jgi:hypothetical protein
LVYAINFCDSSVWIRAHFSAAVTNSICAIVPTAQDPMFLSSGFRSGNSYLDFLRDVEAEYNEETGEQLLVSPRGDICDKAMLFWLLITNGFLMDPPQQPRMIWPMLLGEGSATGEEGWPQKWDERKERQLLDEWRFHRLEEARIGGYLSKRGVGGIRMWTR